MPALILSALVRRGWSLCREFWGHEKGTAPHCGMWEFSGQCHAEAVGLEPQEEQLPVGSCLVSASTAAPTCYGVSYKLLATCPSQGCEAVP